MKKINKTTNGNAVVERRRESARILANQTASTREVSGIQYTSQDEDGRMALLVLLSGASLDRLAGMQLKTAGEAAYTMATAIVAGLYPIKFSSSKDAVTGFVKAFLANNPEGRIKRYIKRFINSDEELKFREIGFNAGEIRKRIIERNARYMTKELYVELKGNESRPCYVDGFAVEELSAGKFVMLKPGEYVDRGYIVNIDDDGSEDFCYEAEVEARVL
jgi:hypothetical protein